MQSKKSIGVGGAVATIVVVLIIIIGLFYLYNNTNLLSSITSSLPSGPVPQNTTTVQPGNQSSYDTYVLSLINKDRSRYGLPNVTLSTEPSAQQHTQSMLSNDYFSHWDIYGMKPYMRYTLVGGRGAVDENVAFNSSYVCIASICKGNINVLNALRLMEYNMMNNDQACCNNGHRDNILDPYHNQVSIGVSYSAGMIYLAEDFVDNYIAWSQGTPQFSNNEVYLIGAIQGSYSLSSITVSYDPPLVNMSQSQLNSTGSYSYGTSVAGVVSNPAYYYSGLTTITADKYKINGNNLNVSFNMQKLISKYGAGEYTVTLWFNTTNSSSFVGSTYTLFINSNGQPYTPSNI